MGVTVAFLTQSTALLRTASHDEDYARFPSCIQTVV
eukprot:CAMPEP_0181484630 /NCGR_PEP_ID=MMETSP1110-20121109/46105_1 /TAXON_ID=174948 /ORGANISM="Symbiodinium sp., Strain CCMP421" /LENGTH=35 /DNA_ID= /DNA_START= /DNA_END= /DNA_ORIENTATION=